jgi:hypothetical protein
MLIFLYIMTVMGLVMGPTYKWYQWLFANIVPSVYGAMVGTTAFFVASASYRAMRARTPEAAVMLIVGILTMLSNVTLSEAIWPGFTPLNRWIMDVAQAGGMRGLTITIAFGFIALGIRIMAGHDTGWLGER